MNEINVSDEASKRPSVPDSRVASGTKLIPIHLFGYSQSLGAIRGFHGISSSDFLDDRPLIFLSVTDQSYYPVTRLSPSMLESANGTTFSSWELDIPRCVIVRNCHGHVRQNFDFTARSFILPVRHRRQSYLVGYLFK